MSNKYTKRLEQALEVIAGPRGITVDPEKYDGHDAVLLRRQAQYALGHRDSTTGEEIQEREAGHGRDSI